MNVSRSHDGDFIFYRMKKFDFKKNLERFKKFVMTFKILKNRKLEIKKC